MSVHFVQAIRGINVYISFLGLLVYIAAGKISTNAIVLILHVSNIHSNVYWVELLLTS